MLTSYLRTIAASLALVAQACSDADPAPSDRSAAVAAHIETIQARIDATNENDWKAWESLHTKDATRTAPELEEPLDSNAAMRAAIESLVTTFPDYHLELRQAFAEGDRVVARIHTHATMLGEMQLGEQVIPPTGKWFEQDWVGVFRFQGERSLRSMSSTTTTRCWCSWV
jgi:predicted ester cyclase